MKKNIFTFFIFFIFFYNVKSQEIDTCFTKEEIKNIYYEVRSLQENDRLCDSIIIEYNTQKQLYKNIIKLDSIKYENEKSINKILEDSNKNLKERVKQLEPKWYDDKVVWFGLGVFLTIIGYSL